MSDRVLLHRLPFKVGDLTHKKFRPNRTEGQPVGEMNSPQGEDRAVLVEKGLRLRSLASLGTAGSVQP